VKKTNYINLIKPKQRLSAELKIEYDKLVTAMKVFFRDSYLTPQTLLSISDIDNGDNSNDVEKIFNIIPNTNQDDMWEQLNSNQVFSKKHKQTNIYKYGLKEFTDPKQKKPFRLTYFDGKNNNLYDEESPSFNPAEGVMSLVLSSHNIKAHAPETIDGYPTSKDLLSKYLSKKDLLFFEFSKNKTLSIKYPVLHPKIITYISLIKRALSIFLKSNDINFSSIDILPSENNRLLLFIASSEAKDLNTFCSENSFLSTNPFRTNFDDCECSPLANSFTIFLDRIFNKSHFYMKNDDAFLYFDLNFYTRDKSLKFDTIMNKRMERIIKTIQSLNNLHHRGNYEFDKSDFDISYKKLSSEIEAYRILYERWFKENAVPKSAEEEIKMLRKELAKKEELLKKSKK